MKRSHFWAAALVWCIAIASALTFSRAVLGTPTVHFAIASFATAMTYALAIGVPTTLLLPPMLHAVQSRHLVYRIAVGLIVPPIISVPCSLVGTTVLVLVDIIPVHEQWMRWQADVRVALLISIAIGAVSTVYGSFRARLEKTQLELKIQELARERVEKLSSEAQLAALASRIQPHFLFNTLNSISSLIRTDPIRAERILGRLAALLRTSLDTREGDLVPLRKEIKLVGDYLEIQHVRYPHRLTYTLDVPSTLMEHRVPPFSIQTLVENSVKFAVAPKDSTSTIRVVVSMTGGRLCVEVWDDGPGFSADEVRPHHGIDNLRKRLVSLYSGAARVAIGRGRFQARGPELTRVAFELPAHGEAAA